MTTTKRRLYSVYYPKYGMCTLSIAVKQLKGARNGSGSDQREIAKQYLIGTGHFKGKVSLPPLVWESLDFRAIEPSSRGPR
ncbi:MAG: hypothetical protein ABI303_01320 [Candidatus Saccharimonas sp.]